MKLTPFGLTLHNYLVVLVLQSGWSLVRLIVARLI